MVKKIKVGNYVILLLLSLRFKVIILSCVSFYVEIL